MSPNGDASTRSHASSIERTRSTASSGPKISSCSTGESAGRSAASVGAANQPRVGHVGGAARDPALRLRGRRVARDALLRLALDHRRDVDLGVGRLADVQHLDRARQPLDQRVVDRLVGEHPRGRRALLARVVERGLHERGHDVVEVGVGVHDHAVLAAHLGHDALQVPLAGRHLRRAAHDLQPDRARAGERDRVHARVADELRADRPLAGQQRQRARRQAGLAQRAHDRERARRRLLGGLEDDRVAGRQPGRDHPERDRDREVPGRDHGDDRRAGASAARCARRGAGSAPRRRPGAPPARSRRARSTRGSRSPRTRRRRPRATAWRVSRTSSAAISSRRSRSHCAARTSTSARSAAGRRPQSLRAGEIERVVDVGLGRDRGLGHDPLRLAGVGRDQRAAGARVVADPHRHLDHRLGVERLQRARELRAHGRPPQLQDRFVCEGLHAGAASSSSSGTPRACSYRNDSLEVFSSSRRTR